MASNKPVKVDPKELKNAQALYESFIDVSKKSIIVIAAVLLLLAVVFL